MKSFEHEPTRFQIFVEIERERAYQDARWGGLHHDRAHGLSAWMEMMLDRLASIKQRSEGGKIPFDEVDAAVLAEIRKVTAMGVACMEAHGLARRAALSENNP